MTAGTRLALVVVLASGCGNFESVDDACKDHVRGQGNGSAEAVEVVGRITCYRRFVGLDAADIDGRITEAVEAHASYLVDNDVLSTTGEWQFEDPSGTGFTGATSYDRLEASEYLVEDVGSAFVWEVLLAIDAERSRAGLIDDAMNDPFVRDVFLAPSWEGSGYAEGRDELYDVFAYMNIVLYFPSGARSTRPVVYPADGQEDVPPAWGNPYSGDPSFPDLASLVGYPITFTMGSSDVGSLGSPNPLQVAVLDSAIVGPGGPVDHVVVLPGLYVSGPMFSTAALIPNQPLDAESTYTVTATLSWIGVDEHTVETTFTTGPDGDTTVPFR